MKRYLLIIILSLSVVLNGEEKKLYIIPIEGTIEPSLTVFIRNGIEEAGKSNSDILFKINTFGGRVDSALQIATLIGSAKGKTIAYIPADPETLGVSWSAGALITLSCKEIYMAEGTSIGAAAPVFLSPEGSQAADEKTVSAVRVQMSSLAEKNGYPKGVALAMVDKDVELHEVEVDGEIKLLASNEITAPGKIISPKGKLLTLTAKEMEKYGISKGTINSSDELISSKGYTNSIVWEKNVPDKVVAFLTSGAVIGLLMTLGLITLYLALTSPGFGLLGAIGIICFSIIFLGGQLLGTLGSFELILFLAGVVLLTIEIFVIPGFGITGISGISAIILSLILSQQDFIIPKWSWQWSQFNRNILITIISILVATIVIFILMSLFPRLPLFNRLILATSQNFTNDSRKNEEELIGKTGEVTTKLRPVGKVSINSKTYTCKSQGQFIPKGSRVEIVSKESNNLIVREVPNETSL